MSESDILKKKAELRNELRDAMSVERAQAMIKGDHSALYRHLEALHRAIAREQQITIAIIEGLL